MNVRERFHAVAQFKPGVRTLRWGFAYWNDTIERWYQEGLPCSPYSPPPDMSPEGTVWGEFVPFPRKELEDHRDVDVHNFFRLDDGAGHIPLNWGCYPPFEEMILEEDENSYLKIDSGGTTVRRLRHSTSVPQTIDWPVHTRANWEEMKTDRFSSERIAGRFPNRWKAATSAYNERDYPLGLNMPGFYSSPRGLMGVMKTSTMYYDDPKLMHDINDTLANVWLSILEEVVSKIDLDFVHIWEDMAYNSGPLISPAMFKEFCTPYYRRITDFLRGRGVNVILVDCDGNCRVLIPHFIEAGVSGLYPFEVNAGMDIMEIRHTYPELLINGGLGKFPVIEGKQAIDFELESKLPYMLTQGGYIPFLDHSVPRDISWENFKYYRERVNQYIERYRPK